MKGAVLHGPYDVRYENRNDPEILEPTDVIIRLSASCVCGSDLWPYRGVQKLNGPQNMGHEYCGVIEVIGSDVHTVKAGDFVVGSFFASDNTCQICAAGYQCRCVDARLMGIEGAQAPYLRVPLADDTLVKTDSMPPQYLIPSMLAAEACRTCGLHCSGGV